MKVLVLATDVFTRGGIARYTSTLASSLGRMLGPENVDVLCFFDWGYTGVKPREFGLLGTFTSRPHAGVVSQAKFLGRAAWAGVRGYDLVIANHVVLAPVAALMRKVFGTPYWVTCHSIEIWWGATKLQHAALKRANLILPVSEYTADVVRKMEGIDPARVRVVYNAIPESLAQALGGDSHSSAENANEWGTLSSAGARASAGPIALSVCALVRGNEFKGVDTVIRALPRVLESVPDLRYVVVGDGEIRPALEKLAAELGVASHVIFAGEISDAELVAAYRECSLFVLPSRGQSRKGVAGGEGFGRVYVEAAFAGKPVVGSQAGGAAEAVLHGRTGFVVNPESRDEVAEAMLGILQYPELAARMGAVGRAWALDTFSEEALGGALRELLRDFGFSGESLSRVNVERLIGDKETV